MKKNGFVFVESVAVLVIIILALTLFLSSYNVLVRKSKAKDYYDLPKDKYLLYNIVNLGNPSSSYNVNTSFITQKTTCATYMSDKLTDCAQVFDDSNLERLLVIYDLKTTLETGTIVNIVDGSNKITSDIIEYLKTLKKSDENGVGLDYVVGVFKRGGKYYYASLSLTGGSNQATYTFNYTGSYRVDNDNTVRTGSYSFTSSTWKIYLLTDGEFTSTTDNVVDIFAVGGGGSGSPGKVYAGGGGGGGGYTKTVIGQPLTKNTRYTAVIGAGGEKTTSSASNNISGKAGKATTFKDSSNTLIMARGGLGGLAATNGSFGAAGGSGGSGGGGGKYGSSNYSTNITRAGNGGSGGTNGVGTGSTTDHIGLGGYGCASCSSSNISSCKCIIQTYGENQEFCNNTRAFCESGETIYSGGGGGGSAYTEGAGRNSINPFDFLNGLGGNAGGGNGFHLISSSIIGETGNYTDCTDCCTDCGDNSCVAAQPGTPNTGGGGGGGGPTKRGENNTTGEAGGSGIIIIRNHQ